MGVLCQVFLSSKNFRTEEMRLDSGWTAAFVAFALLEVVQGLYFHIAETERKCFIEEIPEETMVQGNYKLQLYDPRTNGFAPSSPEIGMHVEIRDPEDKIIMSKVYSSEGKWTFTSHAPGEHVICLYTNSTKWFSGTQLRVHLDISVGEHAIDYANLAKNEKLSELQLRVRQQLDQVEQITKEQNYQRYREERFRQTSESTNQRVFVGSCTNCDPFGYGILADEASQEFL